MEAFKLIQLANAFSQSMFAYTFDGKPRPFSASFAVSNRCNIHCSYCNFPNMDPTELSLGDIETIFDRLKKLGVKRLGLLGGEPLLRKDILKIIQLAKERGFMTSLNTNLLLYDKYKDKLDDIDYFFTSLDGDPERHAANRGKQDYERILAAIRDIVSRGKKITAICVVTDPEIAIADYLLDLAEKEKINVHFQPECYDTEIVLRSAPAKMEDKKIRAFWQYLFDKKKSGSPISSSLTYLKYISEWSDYSISSYYDENERCGAGRGFLFVDAKGDAYPCAYTKGKAEGVSLITEDYADKFDKQTPCTKCIVGPMLEFNMLFQKPLSSITNALSNV